MSVVKHISPLDPPGGCRFHPRCPVAIEKCKTDDPLFEELKPDHWVACWAAKEQIASQAPPLKVA